jgi:hypothetical protein
MVAMQSYHLSSSVTIANGPLELGVQSSYKPGNGVRLSKRKMITYNCKQASKQQKKKKREREREKEEDFRGIQS